MDSIDILAFKMSKTALNYDNNQSLSPFEQSLYRLVDPDHNGTITAKERLEAGCYLSLLETAAVGKDSKDQRLTELEACQGLAEVAEWRGANLAEEARFAQEAVRDCTI